MSFDVFLARFVDGDPAEVNRGAVRNVLESVAHGPADEFGFYVIEFPDGTQVDFSASGLDRSEDFTTCAFHIGGSGIGDHLVKFIFDVAKAGGMVILVPMDELVVMLTAPEQGNHLPADVLENKPELVPCGSELELAAVLSRGYEGWSKYRDFVVGDAGHADGQA